MSDLVERMVYTGNSKPWWMAHSTEMDTHKGRYGGMDAITVERVLELVPELGDRIEKRPAGFYSLSRDAWTKSEGDCFLVNTRTGFVTGRCTEAYKEYQAGEASLYLDRLSGEYGARYHTAGILDGGRKVWFLIQTPSRFDVRRASGKVDTHYQFILSSLDFTGKGSNVLCGTDVNVVCANTEAIAVGGSELKFRVPHKGDMDAQYEIARQAIVEIESASHVLQVENQRLADTPLGIEDFIKFSTQVFLDVEGEKEIVETKVAEWFRDASDRSQTILQNKVAKTTNLFVNGIGNEGVSKYDALQSFTKYFDHFDIGAIRNKVARGKRQAQALTSSFDGSGSKIKSKVRARLLAAA